jgi:hypothetical protein
LPVFLKKEFDNNNFETEVLSNDILLVKNFMSKEELEEVFNIINNTKEEDWYLEYLGHLKNFCMEKFGRDDVENLVAEGKFEITPNWEDKNLTIKDSDLYTNLYSRIDTLLQKANPDLHLIGISTLQRMQPKTDLTLHTDQYTDPAIMYAAIIYLNDDYSNGELFFENKNLEVKPKPGSLLVFPGDESFKHGVRLVGDGPTRYVIVGFIKEKNFYENNKY